MEIDNLQIIYRAGKPQGIRDTSGFLLFFPEAHHYTGQDERYKRDLANIEGRAKYLLTALINRGESDE